MRVLLSAFACEPGRGSEPNIGWEVARHLGESHRVTVLTDASHERAIRGRLADAPLPAVEFHFLRPPRWLSFPRPGAVVYPYLYYTLWQRRAFSLARRLHREQRFDLIHHLTYVNPWAPTFMGWVGAPFVWSAGSRDTTPLAMLRRMSARSRIAELTRGALIHAGGAVNRLLVARRSALILTVSGPDRWPAGLPVRPFAMGGLGEEDVASLRQVAGRTGGPLRIASIGRLLGLKGFDMALRAFAALRREVTDAEYSVVGDGPERPRLERLAARLGCAGGVTFHGWLPRDAVIRCLRDVDVVVQPSLHESFGYAVLEAMAAARPVVCLAVGGPAHLVREDTGCLIAPSEPDRVVAQILHALRRLASDPCERARLGANARAVALAEWTWERVVARLNGLYAEAAGQKRA